jgi:2'-5' RNA ligase
MRLFIAIQFSEEIRCELLDAIDELRAQAAGGNFTRPENLHLTLAFIGETNDAAAVRRVIDAVPASPFTLSVGGAGHFGDLYWVGVSRNPALCALADSLRDGLLRAGFAIDTKPFKPHITVGRQVVHEGPVSLDVPLTEMTVSRVSLMKSERVNGKLVYTELYGRRL